MTTTHIPEYFNDLRPYNQKETKQAILRLQKSKTFFKTLKYIFPEKSFSVLQKLMSEINSTYDFQHKIMYEFVENIIKKSAEGLSFSGFENIKKNQNYVFLSNHRDIFLDSALLQYLLLKQGFDTTEITFGNNLMSNKLILDIGKINKMFKVYRKGKPKELLKKTAELSEYIRYTINEKKQSVWIAQRGGRTKDGNDKTQNGILKMLNSSGNYDFEKNIKDLNIVPVSLSYEFEPCDIFKIRELYISKNQKYFKSENEDIESIIEGVKAQKGKINLTIGKPIKKELEKTKNIKKLNEKVNILSKLIDIQIYKNYKLMPTNYIAYDLFYDKKNHSDKYTEAQKNYFTKYANKKINKISGNFNDIKKLFLKLYANPVINEKQT